MNIAREGLKMSRNCFVLDCVSIGRYRTWSAALVSFFTSYPDGEKKVSTILWSGYNRLSSSKMGSPCSYSPKEATCIQIQGWSEVEIVARSFFEAFLPFTNNPILELKMAISCKIHQAILTKRLYSPRTEIDFRKNTFFRQ